MSDVHPPPQPSLLQAAEADVAAAAAGLLAATAPKAVVLAAPFPSVSVLACHGPGVMGF